jgi:putative PIN family toxin of toxin-antitoxin system
MRAVVDTNVLVSGLIRPRGPIGLVIRGLRDRRFVSVVSRSMLEEVVDVLGRAWLREKYGLGAKDIEVFLRLLVLRSELVEPIVTIQRCRDPRDDGFLETALAGRAERLVTGDADLLALGSHEGIRIVSPARFAAELD